MKIMSMGYHRCAIHLRNMICNNEVLSVMLCPKCKRKSGADLFFLYCSFDHALILHVEPLLLNCCIYRFFFFLLSEIFHFEVNCITFSTCWLCRIFLNH